MPMTPTSLPAPADIRARVARLPIPEIEAIAIADVVADIERLKRERGAIVLAHNYMTPDIYHTVADFTGDSLALAQLAATTDAGVIVMAGVHFMAETAKIANPGKTVLIPDREAGCSLAASITGADVRLLKAQYPGVPVVTYVNTSADVKAESDVCCTSGNAVEIVEALGTDRVIFLPDHYLGRWVASQVKAQIILWHGACEVHERFTGAELRAYRVQHAGIRIIAHPECPPDVLAEADYVGSTKGMIDWVASHRPASVVMVTECSMADNVALEHPGTRFVRPCNLCPHMKRITLDNIRLALAHLQHEVVVEPAVAARARRAVDRMLEISAQRRVA